MRFDLHAGMRLRRYGTDKQRSGTPSSSRIWHHSIDTLDDFHLRFCCYEVLNHLQSFSLALVLADLVGKALAYPQRPRLPGGALQI